MFVFYWWSWFAINRTCHFLCIVLCLLQLWSSLPELFILCPEIYTFVSYACQCQHSLFSDDDQTTEISFTNTKLFILHVNLSVMISTTQNSIVRLLTFAPPKCSWVYYSELFGDWLGVCAGVTYQFSIIMLFVALSSCFFPFWYSQWFWSALMVIVVFLEVI